MAQHITINGLNNEQAETFAGLILREVYKRHPELVTNEDNAQDHDQVKLALGWYTLLRKPGHNKTRLGAVKGLMGPWLGVADFEACMEAAGKQLNAALATPNPHSKRQLKREAKARKRVSSPWDDLPPLMSNPAREISVKPVEC